MSKRYIIDDAVLLIEALKEAKEGGLMLQMASGQTYTLEEAAEKGVKGKVIKTKGKKELEREIKELVFGKARVSDNDIKNLEIVLKHFKS